MKNKFAISFSHCVAAFWMMCLPSLALACSIPPPPAPPAPLAGETPAEYAARVAEFEGDQAQAKLIKAASSEGYRRAVEDTMWTTANRVFLAEITARGDIEMMDTQGRAYTTSPQVHAHDHRMG